MEFVASQNSRSFSELFNSKVSQLQEVWEPIFKFSFFVNMSHFQHTKTEYRGLSN